jgi:hypothetical protein
MIWILVAIVVAGFLASFTDWFFMGVLFKDRYERYPEVWWPQIREKGETRPIIYSTALGFVTAAAVIALCAAANVQTIMGGLGIAALAALAGPFVTTITNGFWIKFDPMVTLAHTAGYVVRFLIAGIAAGIVLPLS